MSPYLCLDLNLSPFSSCLELSRFRAKFTSGCCAWMVIRLPQLSQKQAIHSEPLPVVQSVKAFASATTANLRPGFDFLGCAVEGIGGYVGVQVDEDTEPGNSLISSINGDNDRLSPNPKMNCAGIAAKATVEMLGVRTVDLSLSLGKGLPLVSAVGSSAASAAAAAAAAVAANDIFGGKLAKSDLVLAGLESAAVVSGYHADNVAPSLMGGFILVRSYGPLDCISLAFPSDKELFFVLVNPVLETPTKEMRAVLPTAIATKDHILNCSQAAALVAAVLWGDPCLLGAALSLDSIVEPSRGPLIPGMLAVKATALEAGTFGFTISGPGPTVVTITDNTEKGKSIADAMVEMFHGEGKLEASASVRRLGMLQWPGTMDFQSGMHGGKHWCDFQWHRVIG